MWTVSLQTDWDWTRWRVRLLIMQRRGAGGAEHEAAPLQQCTALHPARQTLHRSQVKAAQHAKLESRLRGANWKQFVRAVSFQLEVALEEWVGYVPRN